MVLLVNMLADSAIPSRHCLQLAVRGLCKRTCTGHLPGTLSVTPKPGQLHTFYWGADDFEALSEYTGINVIV